MCEKIQEQKELVPLAQDETFSSESIPYSTCGLDSSPVTVLSSENLIIQLKSISDLSVDNADLTCELDTTNK